MTESTETSSENINLVRSVPKFVPPPKTEPVKELDPIIPGSTTEPPIEHYENKHGHPYLADKYDIADVYQNMGLSEGLKSVDSYILSRITEDSLQSTKQAYDSILAKLEAEIGIDPNLDFDKRVEKLSSYISILKEEKRIEKLKKEFNVDSNK